MINNQYLRLVQGGRLDLEESAKEADARRERGEDLGPPPTPTPKPQRRYGNAGSFPIVPTFSPDRKDESSEDGASEDELTALVFSGTSEGIASFT
ncbi:hypothetical protein AA0117_g9280 [Alternaria alternata]|uniref:Uncharacterized protein n=1 Tax=Alternaria alternata TaxID=5599 RepID=A0A4V1WQV2_ALTAL|nr:hypothetical protein AA0117_g9280 [Alternaria alternata]